MDIALLRTLFLFLCLSASAFADETEQEQYLSTPEASQVIQGEADEDSNQEVEVIKATDSTTISQNNHLYPEEKDTVRLKFLSQKRNEIIQQQTKLSKKIRSLQNQQEEQERLLLKDSRFEEVDKKMNQATLKMQSAEEEIYEINKKAILENEDSPLRKAYALKINQLNQLKELHEKEQDRLSMLRNQETHSVQQAARSDQDITPRLEQAQEQYDETAIKLLNIENNISELLNRDSLNNDFRVQISIAFTALVAIVIIGFYWLAFRKDEISANIFSGEKGIQFITLFLIVIAIILFGIMGTLESRELSALLGALSGYILGKTSVPKDS